MSDEFDCRTNNCPATIDDSTRAKIPAADLCHLSDVWRRHASQCDGDLKLALESCAMDLDRLRDSY